MVDQELQIADNEFKVRQCRNFSVSCVMKARYHTLGSMRRDQRSNEPPI